MRRRDPPWGCSLLTAVLAATTASLLGTGGMAPAGERVRIEVASSLDASSQRAYLIVPDRAGDDAPRPLLVALHPWSGDVESRDEPLEKAATARGWIYLWPHFRGPNDRPEACGSQLAQQDILDAVAWVAERYPVDPRRIYLTGSSGGGHMTMLMAARHPQVWAAASAWVGISDLAAWHERHAAGRYGQMLRRCCGGPPGASEEVDAEYRARSPLTWLAAARELPLDLAAGVHDGHTGSVPIAHSLLAFNVVARAAGAETITDDEITQLSRPDGRLDQPDKGDVGFDPVWGRAYYLRRMAGPVRVTVFEGGHEGLAEAAVDWLSRHTRPGGQ